MALPVDINVETAFVVDVVPSAVLGNENAAGVTENCVIAGGGAAPAEAEPEEGVGVVALGATGGSGTLKLLQAAVSAIHASITAIESQRLRERSI